MTYRDEEDIVSREELAVGTMLLQAVCVFTAAVGVCHGMPMFLGVFILVLPLLLALALRAIL